MVMYVNIVHVCVTAGSSNQIERFALCWQQVLQAAHSYFLSYLL